MDDDFEVYAEDNYERELEKLRYVPRNHRAWQTFDEEDDDGHIDVLWDDEKLATVKHSSIPSNFNDNEKIMFIRYKKNGENSELQELLRQLHAEKLEDVTIIFHTNYASLNEDEIDLLETFYNHYDNFHIDYEDKETPKRVNDSDDDTESDDEGPPIEDNEVSEPKDLTIDHLKEMQTIRKTLMEMEHGDPRRLDLAEKFMENILNKLQL